MQPHGFRHILKFALILSTLTSAPSQAQPATTRPVQSTLNLPGNADHSKIPLARGREGLFAKVAVNGIEAGWFLLDTGANHSLIDTQAANRLGLKPQWESKVWFIGGKRKVQVCEVNDVSLTGISAGPRYIALASLDLERKSGLDYAGIIGTDILFELPLTLDFREPSLTFYHSGKVPNEIRNKATPARFHFAPGHLIFPAKLEMRTGRFILDTGMMGCQLATTDSFLHDLDFKNELSNWHSVSQEFGGAYSTLVTCFNELEVAGKLTKHVWGDVELRDPQAYGLVPRTCTGSVGPDIFRDSRLTLDAQHQESWIEWLPPESANDYLKRIEQDNLSALVPAPLLVRAIDEQRPDAVKVLIDRGVDLNERNSRGRTPLIAAVDDPELVKLLLAKGASPNTPGASPSALLAAVKACKLESVRLLIAAGANPEADSDSDNALTWAVGANSPEIVQMLFKAHPKFKDEVLPIIAGIESGNKELLASLLAQRPNLNSVSKRGHIALLQASLKSDEQLGRMLLDAGADVNRRDGNGYTALHGAAWSGNTKFARFLLAAGADPKLKDKSGKTAADMAASQGELRTLQAIQGMPDWNISIPDGAPNVTIPLAWCLHAPCVRLSINGQDAGWFILSLKCSGMFIDTKVADKLKLSKIDVPLPWPKHELREAKEISINGLSAGRRLITAMDLASDPITGGKFSGYLDRSFLLDHPSVLDFRDMTLTLYRKGELPASLVKSAQALRVDFSYGSPAIRASVNGMAGWFWLNCEYDTSVEISPSFFNIMDPGILKNAHPLHEPRLAREKLEEEIRFSIKEFDFSGRRSSSHSAVVAADDAQPWRTTLDGSIGCPSPDGRLILDAASNKAWYQWREPEAKQAYLQRITHEAPGPIPTTPLFRAIQDERYDAATLLIEQGADVNAKTVGDRTPLMLAHHSPDLIKLMLAKGADPNAKAIFLGRTPLILAARSGNVETLKLLIAAGAKVDQPTTQGRTALSIAAEAAYPEVIDLLASAGADVDRPDSRGLTPLMFAAAADSPTAVAMLLKHKAKINKLGQYTALGVAACEGHLEMLQTLLKAGAAVNQTGTSGATPLMGAAIMDEVDAVRALLAAGADPTIKIDGMTAFDMAEKERKFDVMRVLKFETAGQTK